jgi:hypothetical protein
LHSSLYKLTTNEEVKEDKEVDSLEVRMPNLPNTPPVSVKPKSLNINTGAVNLITTGTSLWRVCARAVVLKRTYGLSIVVEKKN